MVDSFPFKFRGNLFGKGKRRHFEQFCLTEGKVCGIVSMVPLIGWGKDDFLVLYFHTITFPHFLQPAFDFFLDIHRNPPYFSLATVARQQMAFSSPTLPLPSKVLALIPISDTERFKRRARFFFLSSL